MLNFLRRSLSIEIEDFTSFLKLGSLKRFTKSAFVQARMKIKPEVFEHLSQTLVKEFYTDNETAIKLWNNYRLLSVDGSRITLPFTEALREQYSEVKNKNNTGVIQARCSVLYDVENQYVLEGKLTPLKQGERSLAISHLKHCKAQDLIIYDRGYPSYGLIKEHVNRDLQYLMRVKISFNKQIIAFAKSNKETSIVDIIPGKYTKKSEKLNVENKAIKVRLVKVKLPKKETEILITSLLDIEQFPSQIFKALYKKRWGVETYYDELKNKLKIEYFSGYSNQSIQQDFYATLFISNIQTLILSELEEEIAEENKTKKYNYKVNTNLSYGFLKNRILDIFFTEKSQEYIIIELKKLFKENQIPIRPNRSNSRNPEKYRTRRKPKVTKNQKDAI